MVTRKGMKAHYIVFLFIGVIAISGCVDGDSPPSLDVPSLSPPSPQAGETFQIQVTASDDKGMKALAIEVDGFTDTFQCNGQRTCRNTWSRSVEKSGSYQIAVAAVDTANKKTTRTVTITIGGGPPGVCNNNGVCEPGEDTASCPADCPAGPRCGDEVCDSGETASCPADCPEPAASRFGLILSGSGGKIVSQTDIESQVVPIAQAAHVDSMRIFHLGWNTLEPQQGTFDWASADESIMPFSEKGISLLVTLFSNSCWGTNQPEPCAPTDEPSDVDLPDQPSALPTNWDAFDNYVRQMVTRYKDDVDYWQLENEVYVFNGLWFSGPAADYVAVVNRAYPIIKEIDPTSTVILSGIQAEVLRSLSGVEPVPPEQTSLMETIRQNVKTVLSTAQYDAAAVHIYWDPEDIPTQIAWLNSELAAAGKAGTPIIATEGGGPGGPTDPLQPGYVPPSEDSVARDVVKRYTVLFASGVDQFYLYSVATRLVIAEQTGSAFTITNRPAFYAFQEMSEKLAGFTLVEQLDKGSGVSVYTFMVGGKKVMVAWSDGGSATVDLSSEFSNPTVTLKEIVTETDAAGNPRLKTALSVATNAVPLTGTPVFLS